MAIDAKCPNCSKAYRLKDDLLGKKVTCANQECRKIFEVVALPAPVANGSAAHKPLPAVKTIAKPLSPIDADALAAAAFADDPMDVVPEDQRTIAMICTICEEKWTVAWAMQGKNTLCPECKTRQKVPEQKSQKKADWRDGSGRPSQAKIEELDGVVDAQNKRNVSGEALIEAGVIRTEYESRPTSFYVKIAAVVLIGLGCIGGGIAYSLRSRHDNREQRLYDEIVKAFAAPEYKQLPLYSAALHIAAGEHEAREDTTDERDRAVDHFTKALIELNNAPSSADRELLYAELAYATLLLGGEGEDLQNQKKLSWLPPSANGSSRARIRPSKAEEEGVQGQLRRVLQGLRDSRADFDVRAAVVRKLTRELLKVNQVEVIRSNLQAAFADSEQTEAEAQIGLECLRGNQPELAREIGEKLERVLKINPQTSPVAASAVALWQAVEPPIKGPSLVSSPGSSGEISEGTRFAYVALDFLQKKPDEARAIATRPGRADAQLRVLAFGAEWSDKPIEWTDDAAKILADLIRRKDPNIRMPEMALVRLGRIAAKAGSTETAEEFAKAIPDEQLRVWARAENLRYRLQADRSVAPGDDAAPIPTELTDLRKFFVGHAWGRLALARANADRTRKRSLAATYAKDWPTNTIAPFGQAGVALGLQDAQRR